ncbi:L(+)-tartrate dehydratase subunit beta [Methanobrevibacter curvatus]|uniref:L(+)-tartrate dehydratase subunit beta n=1 Tax=Methanobrevibacter curvatus TaxID=49547 RepID=A0A166B1B5_9EURY|nr:L(+)-tartrate dehydratase subunit beta [Methanobrevibacter curvatus]
MEKIQLRDNIIELNSPIDDDILSKLKIGDIVYINGKIITARDQAHKKIIEEGSPIDLNGIAIFHAGPIIKVIDKNKTDLNNYEMVAIGPTTSMRMNPYESDVLDMGAKIIIGKGGMDEKTVEALKRNKAVYLVATGGCAALYVSSIKKISGVDWLDLGIPEAIWQLEVNKFGPLIVASDSHGNTLFSK